LKELRIDSFGSRSSRNSERTTDELLGRNAAARELLVVSGIDGNAVDGFAAAVADGDAKGVAVGAIDPDAGRGQSDRVPALTSREERLQNLRGVLLVSWW
jgi:hypothetical protein